MELRDIARALGGEVSSGQVLFPGPGHSARDRSCSLRVSPGAPDGFLVFSHASDDWRDVRDYVRERLGTERTSCRREVSSDCSGARTLSRRRDNSDSLLDDAARSKAAVRLWEESRDPRVHRVYAYFQRRKLELTDDLSGDVLRWHAGSNALVALFRNIHTGEPQAITRIYLEDHTEKPERKFLGPVGGSAIMCDAFEDVTMGLHVGEGLETTLAGRQLGLKPAWALGSSGAIGKLPMLGGIDALTVLAEFDDHGANARAIEEVGARWQAAGREVLVVTPTIGDDVNSAVMGKPS